MENFEKIAIAVVIFVITSIVAYLFRMRQLYVAVPKLYKEPIISKNGSLCEINIYNRGNQVEEEISISLEQSLKIELLASSATDVTLSESVIKIHRLHKNSEVSALLLVENGILTHDKINLATSKGTTAKVLKNSDNVPSNYAHSLVAFALLICLAPAVNYSIDAYRFYEKKRIENQLKPIYKMGWSGLADYYKSNIKQSYSNQEFPVRYISKKMEKNGDLSLIFEGNNKTASPLKIYVFEENKDPREKLRLFEHLEVSPITSQQFVVTLPKQYKDFDIINLQFTLSMEEEFLSKILIKINNKKIS